MRGILFIFLSLLLVYSGIAMFAGSYSATPVVQIIGPGSLPSTCAKRSLPYFQRNQQVLSKIADTLIQSDRYSVIWVSKDTDFWKMELIDENSNLRVDVAPEQADFDTFLPLFNELETNDFNSPIIFTQNDEVVTAIQSASTCGPSILDWIKFRLNIGEPTKGRPHALAIAYIYFQSGVTEISVCSEPLPKFEDAMDCEIRLDKNWIWGSRWRPEHIIHLSDTKD